MVFNSSANPPCFAPRNSDDDEDENQIQKGTKVRLKIVGTRVDATEIFAIGASAVAYISRMCVQAGAQGQSKRIS